MRQLFGYFSLVITPLLLLLAAAQAAAGEGPGGLQPFVVLSEVEKRAAPDLTLKDMDGQERTLGEFRGRVVVLHFWASWCVPCTEEFPALSALASELGPRGLAVVAVAGDSRARVEAFLRENEARFPVLIDQYGSAMREYRVGLIPVSVIVGRDGRIIGTLIGPRDYASPEARGYFESLLE